MNCFECAKTHDPVAAVGICLHCGVALCLDHLVEAHELRVAGTTYACHHEFPSGKPLRTVPAVISAGTRHYTGAGVR